MVVGVRGIVMSRGCCNHSVVVAVVGVVLGVGCCGCEIAWLHEWLSVGAAVVWL